MTTTNIPTNARTVLAVLSVNYHDNPTRSPEQATYLHGKTDHNGLRWLERHGLATRTGKTRSQSEGRMDGKIKKFDITYTRAVLTDAGVETARERGLIT